MIGAITIDNINAKYGFETFSITTLFKLDLNNVVINKLVIILIIKKRIKEIIQKAE